MARPLFTPPHLRLPGQSNDRHATWLELFYDLVFAVAVSALGTRLTNEPTLLATLQTVALFLPVWWAWVGHTVYDTRFDTDDLFQRLCTLGMMVGAALMAATLPWAFVSQSALFAAGYVGTRACLLLLYLRAYRHVPAVRPIIRLYLSGFSMGAALWIISIFFPLPWRYGFWLLGIGIEFATPWVGQQRVRHAPLDTTHVPERFASFTIIVLGLLIAVIVGRLNSPTIALASYLAALLAFCLVVCIWWLYFTFLSVAPVDATLGPGQPFIYVHLPLVLGLILLGVALNLSIDEATHPTLSLTTCSFFGVGLLLWSLSGLVLKLVIVRMKSSSWIVARIVMLIGIVVLAWLGTMLPPLLTLAILVGTLTLFVMLEVRHMEHLVQARSPSEKHEKTQM